MNKLVLLFAVFTIAACASKKEKTEFKNPLEVLNGENYGVDPSRAQPTGGASPEVAAGAALTGIPVMGAKNKATRIHEIGRAHV